MRKLAFLLFIREIKDKIMRISKYMLIYIYIKNVKDDYLIIARVLTKIYLIDNFNVNLFIDVDVIASQIMILNFEKHTIYIDNCEIIAFINVIIRRNTYVKRTIRIK